MKADAALLEEIRLRSNAHGCADWHLLTRAMREIERLSEENKSNCSRCAELERELADASALALGAPECNDSRGGFVPLREQMRNPDFLHGWNAATCDKIMSESQFNFALGLLDSARQEITPVPGETAALCRAIDDFLETGVVPDNCPGLATEEHKRGRSEVSPGELAEDAANPSPERRGEIVPGSEGKRYPGCPVTEPGAKCGLCEASCEGPWLAYPEPHRGRNGE